MIEISEKEFLAGKHDTLIIDELAKDNLIIFPSESSYGFAGNCLSKTVCNKIHKTKKEERTKPIGLIADCCKKVKKIAKLSDNGTKLLNTNFDRPLTLLLKEKKPLPCTNNTYIGIRIPLNKTALKLCEMFEFPLTAPSANLHNAPAIYSAQEILSIFGKKDFVFINGGELEMKAPSTYYHLEENRILRAGEISLQEIEKVLK